MPTRPLVMLLALAALLAFVPIQAQAAELEPNDTPAQANPIDIGYAAAVINAELTSRYEHDYYRFHGEAGRTYVVETFNVQAISYSYGATALYVYAPNGTTILADDDNSMNGTGDAQARAVFRAPSTGDYYARIETSWTWFGLYSLRVLAHYDEPGAAWDAANDMEPNDALELAIPIGVGRGQAQTHTLTPSDTTFKQNKIDRDAFRFQATAGVHYVLETFNVAVKSYRGPGIWLYDSDGSGLITDDAYAYGGDANGLSRVAFTPMESGTYTFQVRTADIFGWSGRYSIRVCPTSCLDQVFVPVARR